MGFRLGTLIPLGFVHALGTGHARNLLSSSVSMISDAQFQAFLAYARFRLEGRNQVFVLTDELVEVCGLPQPFWEDLEQRWRQQRPDDFDYKPQALEQRHDLPGAPKEPTMIRFWRTG